MIASSSTHLVSAVGSSGSDAPHSASAVRIAIAGDAVTFYQRRHAADSTSSGWRRLPADALRLYHQPIIGLKEGRNALSGELLCRFQHSDGITEAPAAYLQAAEECGIMPLLDRSILELAVEQTAKNALSSPGQRVCVNMSAQTLVDPAFPAFLISLLSKYRIGGDRFCLEVTESSPIADLAAAQAAMTMLRSRGFQFALDDFGTGYASPDVLMRLPLDYVKIPGQFVEDEGAAHAEVLRFIIAMAAHLGLPTIAEHVTSASILQRMRMLGVDYAQGYAVGPILPFAAAS